MSKSTKVTSRMLIAFDFIQVVMPLQRDQMTRLVDCLICELTVKYAFTKRTVFYLDAMPWTSLLAVSLSLVFIMMSINTDMKSLIFHDKHHLIDMVFQECIKD